MFHRNMRKILDSDNINICTCNNCTAKIFLYSKCPTSAMGIPSSCKVYLLIFPVLFNAQYCSVERQTVIYLL